MNDTVDPNRGGEALSGESRFREDQPRQASGDDREEAGKHELSGECHAVETSATATGPAVTKPEGIVTQSRDSLYSARIYLLPLLYL